MALDFSYHRRFSGFSYDIKKYAHSHVWKMLLRNRARRGPKCAPWKKRKGARMCNGRFVNFQKRVQLIEN